MGCYAVRFLILWLSAALLAGLAQTDRGVITGTVRDSSGAVVPGARVTATHSSTNVPHNSVSTSSGDFTVPSLPVGRYKLKVELEGFKTYVRSDLELAAAGILRVDPQLELGEVRQTVEVSGSIAALQTETARVQSQVTNRLVDELPLVVGGALRSPFDLATITPEVSPGDQDMRIGGGQAANWGMTLDGINAATSRALQSSWAAINAPSLEAITEFAVETGGFKAEFGHAAGGVLTFVSKSGTNEFHGSAYEFLRNNMLDARGFFEARKRVYKQHDFGVSAGGPVWLLKIYDGRNKSFFFASYEGFRNRVGATATPFSVPPPEFYEGDLRNWVDQRNVRISVYDPATTRQVGGRYIRDPFANNLIPRNRFDSLIARAIPYAAAVKPNAPGIIPGNSDYVRNNFLSYGVALAPWNKTSVKLDHALSAKHRVAGYFGYTRKDDIGGPTGAPSLPTPLSSFQVGYQKSHVVRVNWDYTITPRWLNRAYAGVNMWVETHESPANTRDWKDRVCMANVPDCNQNFLMVGFGGEFSSWNGPSVNGSLNRVYGFKDDMTLIVGSHSFRWGYMMDQTHYFAKGQRTISGEITFNRLSTGVPLDTNQATGGGSAFGAFLLGEAYTGSIQTFRINGNQWRYHGMYWQDDWRVNSRLTLNYGVRYEFTLPPVERRDQYSDFDPTRPNPAADNIPGALMFAGFGPGRENKRSLIPGWYGAVGPRLGFAYSLDSKTVLRCSFARSFGALRNLSGSFHLLGFAQQLTFQNTNQGLSRTFKAEDGMPPWPRPPLIDPSFANGVTPDWWQGSEAVRLPEQLNYSLNIQRQLGPNLLLEVGYSAVMGSHLSAGLLNYNQVDHRNLPPNLSPFAAAGRSLLGANINSAAAQAAGIRKPFSSFSGSVAQTLRPFPQYTGINTGNGGGDHSGHSTYHALIVKLDKRYSSGLTLQTSYVLSKSLTDAEGSWVGGAAMDHFNRGLEKSISGLDETHNLKLSYVYELPVGQGKRWVSQGWASQVVGGWRLAAIHLYTSGDPIGLGTTIGFPTFTGANRPTVATYDGWRAGTASGGFDPAVDRFLQPASFFGVQPTDRFGNITRRNPKMRSFPAYTENLSAAKTFRVREALRLDFRWEAFNLFNRVRFGGLSGATTLQNFNFGVWRTQINDSRRMQLALKLYW